jgi:ABC-type phosphate transport system permease subunit
MLYEILTHTPAWVFALFALLLWLGATQLTGRRVGLRRTLVMPVVMIGLSLYGVLSAFKDQPLAAAAWAAAALGPPARATTRSTAASRCPAAPCHWR